MNNAFGISRQVGGSILEGAIIAIGRSEHGDGRLGAHDVEERERRGVDDASGVNRRDERDGSRDDQSSEQLVRQVARMGGDVKAHAHAPAGGSSPPCETMASRTRRSCRYDMMI